MRKLTLKQKHQSLVFKYNLQVNERFKLHKFLIEHSLSDHTIDSDDPIDDAIKLINKLNRK